MRPSVCILALGLVVASIYSCSDAIKTETRKTQGSSLKGAGIGGYSCEDQARWGKCGESWMHPVCDYACGSGGGSSVYVGGYSCEQQASWGKCGESWMHPVCDHVCGGGGGLRIAYYLQLANGQVVPVYFNPQGGLLYPDLGANNSPVYHPRPYEDRQYTTGGLLYPDLGAHNGPYGGGYGGGYTTGGLLYPDLGAHNGGGYYGRW
jgi:hypothetical protein